MKVNKHVAQLEEAEDAKKLWQSSEWVLDMLRTQSAEPLKKLTDEDLITWYRKTQQS